MKLHDLFEESNNMFLSAGADLIGEAEAQTDLEENESNSLPVVVIYPGRFQPLLPHHVKVFTEYLPQKFNNAVKIMLGTSDVQNTGGKHPFNAQEKMTIAKNLYGIQSNKFWLVKSPYQIESYASYFDLEKYAVVMIYGEKDLARFGFPETGLKMLKPTKAKPDNGSVAAKMQKFNPSEELLPASERIYAFAAPTIQSDSGEAASGSEFRAKFASTPPEEQAALLANFVGKDDPTVLALFQDRFNQQEVTTESTNKYKLNFKSVSSAKRAHSLLETYLVHSGSLINETLSFNSSAERQTAVDVMELDIAESNLVENGGQYVDKPALRKLMAFLEDHELYSQYHENENGLGVNVNSGISPERLEKRLRDAFAKADKNGELTKLIADSGLEPVTFSSYRQKETRTSYAKATMAW